MAYPGFQQGGCLRIAGGGGGGGGGVCCRFLARYEKGGGAGTYPECAGGGC